MFLAPDLLGTPQFNEWGVGPLGSPWGSSVSLGELVHVGMSVRGEDGGSGDKASSASRSIGSDMLTRE